MNPPCAACKKTVYPMEKLNCLDKMWHKGCFRCSSCGMTLNMKNYKGYNKMPYCAAHYPTTKFTAVADTPENMRLKKNTTNQSSLVYHAEYEKQKGTKLNVADDLETMRASKSAQIASEVSYRGVRSQREEQEAHRPDQIIDDGRRNPRHQAVGRISDYDPAENNSSPYSARSQMPTIYDSNKGGRVGDEANRRVGKISDYDPDQNQQWGGQGMNQYNPPPAAAPGYKQPGMYAAPPTHHQPAYHQPPPPQQNQARPPSWNTNANPAPGYGQIFSSPGRDPQQPWPSRQVPQQYRNSSSAPPPQQAPQQEPLPPPAAMPGKSVRYRAVYDYAAADEDEIGFNEGDFIVEVTVIDDGWMEGRNQRTGKYGMLPSNYVEKV